MPCSVNQVDAAGEEGLTWAVRIIAGQLRRRHLLSPPNDSTRPISDRVKEALFNRLGECIDDAYVLDLFAGTGSIGLEAISRGARRVLFVERSKPCVSVLRRNIEALGVEEQCDIMQGDALGPSCLARLRDTVDLVFIDPPYEIVRSDEPWSQAVSQMVRLTSYLSNDGFIILRAPWPLPREIADVHADLIGPEVFSYKTMALLFFQGAGTGGRSTVEA